VPQSQAEHGGQAGQQQGLHGDEGCHARGRSPQHAQHGEVTLAGAHRMQQGHPDRQAGGGQQHDAEAAQHLGAGTDEPHQPRGLECGRGGLQTLLRVDPARQHDGRQRAAVAHQREGDLACLVGFAVVRSGVVVLMHLPDRGEVGEHEAVEHAARDFEHADDLEAVVGMGASAFGQAMAAGKAVADLEAAGSRHLGAEHGLHRARPEGALRQPAPVEAEVVGCRADDAPAAEGVAQRHRHGLRHQGLPPQQLQRRQRDVAGGGVQVEDAGQHDLHGAAFGAHDEVDAGQVAPQAGLDLGAGAQHEGHGREAQGQQQQVQRRRQRAGPEVAPGQADHSTTSATSSLEPSASTTRASWLAMASVQPSRSAASSSKASRVTVWS
jgi:hypothetical protein